MDVEMTMGRFNVARSTLFLWKKKFWDEMMEMKDAKLTGVEDAEREKKSSVIVPVVNQKKIDKVKTKATTATEQIFDLILFKLEREMEFMKKNPEKFGNIKIFELSKLLDIAASYVIPKATKAEEQGAFANMDKKYSQLTQYIQNNFLANTQDDGKKKDTVKGNGRFVTIYPAGTGGGGDGDNEPPIQE
jgi:NADH dehydrogenase/NADH:ubiquinone oxidoreductase subunit G